MEKEEAPEKKLWEGKVSEKIRGPRAEQVWPLLHDFFNLHKVLTGFTTCYGLEGVSGEVGCVRYCSKGSDSSSSWFKEKLVAIDDVKRSLTYELLDSNTGFKSYRATMKVEDIGEEDDEDSTGGCMIEWSFELEPLEGLKLENLVPSYQMGLQQMARRIEDVLALAEKDDQ